MDEEMRAWLRTVTELRSGDMFPPPPRSPGRGEAAGGWVLVGLAAVALELDERVQELEDRLEGGER